MQRRHPPDDVAACFAIEPGRSLTSRPFPIFYCFFSAPCVYTGLGSYTQPLFGYVRQFDRACSAFRLALSLEQQSLLSA